MVTNREVCPKNRQQVINEQFSIVIINTIFKLLSNNYEIEFLKLKKSIINVYQLGMRALSGPRNIQPTL